MNTKLNFACVLKSGNRQHATTEQIETENTNLVKEFARLSGKYSIVHHAPSKKAAADLADSWNNGFKSSGIHMSTEEIARLYL